MTVASWSKRRHTVPCVSVMDNDKLLPLAKLASEYFHVPLQKLLSGDRHHEYVKPRRCCMYIAFDAGYTKPAIAKFWNCDRTTVHSACNKYAKEIKSGNHNLKELIQFSGFVKKFLKKS